MKVELAKCRSGSTMLGKVLEIISKQSPGLRTVWRRHENGFSITYLRRKFMHDGRNQIVGSSTWHTVRHVEYFSKTVLDLKDIF